MREKDPDGLWPRVAAAARRARASLSRRDEAAPLGFAARVVARAFELRRETLLRLWQRWSWRAALLSGAAAVAVAFVAERRQAPPRLEVPEPAFDVPVLAPPP